MGDLSMGRGNTACLDRGHTGDVLEYASCPTRVRCLQCEHSQEASQKELIAAIEHGA